MTAQDHPSATPTWLRRAGQEEGTDGQPLPPPPPPPAPGPTGLANTQPTVIAWLVGVLPPAVYKLGEAFGWFTFSTKELDALTGIYGIVLTGAAWWVHARVYSPATVAKIVEKEKST